jgi:hypothetical protein
VFGKRGSELSTQQRIARALAVPGSVTAPKLADTDVGHMWVREWYKSPTEDGEISVYQSVLHPLRDQKFTPVLAYL